MNSISMPVKCLALAVIILAAGCSTNQRFGHARTAESAAYSADGIYVRHTRLRVAPSHTQAFESLMRSCVAAARAAGAADRAVSFEWLNYREPPGRYWIVQFSATEDGFDTPAGLEGFAQTVGRAERAGAEIEIRRILAALEYETEWIIVYQQKSDWSTVENMATATHPKARIMDRTIRPGKEAAFEEALAARTAYLAAHGYPLPVEGFVIRSGAPGRAQQVVFPVDWPSFHATDSFFVFVQGLDQAAQDEYAILKASLMETMTSAEYYDADFAAELSFSDE